MDALKTPTSNSTNNLVGENKTHLSVKRYETVSAFDSQDPIKTDEVASQTVV